MKPDGLESLSTEAMESTNCLVLDWTVSTAKAIWCRPVHMSSHDCQMFLPTGSISHSSASSLQALKQVPAMMILTSCYMINSAELLESTCLSRLRVSWAVCGTNKALLSNLQGGVADPPKGLLPFAKRVGMKPQYEFTVDLAWISRSKYGFSMRNPWDAILLILQTSIYVGCLRPITRSSLMAHTFHKVVRGYIIRPSDPTSTIVIY